MSDFRRCSKCGDFGWFSSQFREHVCKPIFECRLEDGRDDDIDWQHVHATDHEEAAEKFAERYDSEGGEYMIVSGRGEYFVHVRKPGDSKFERWAVEGETVPQYRATKCEAAQQQSGSEG